VQWVTLIFTSSGGRKTARPVPVLIPVVGRCPLVGHRPANNLTGSRDSDQPSDNLQLKVGTPHWQVDTPQFAHHIAIPFKNANPALSCGHSIVHSGSSPIISPP
jgi:hypothetical protein